MLGVRVLIQTLTTFKYLPPYLLLMAKKKLTVESISSTKMKKAKAIFAPKIPKRISAFKAFKESEIAEVPTYRAAEITMMLAADKKGNFRPTKLKKNFEAKNPSFAQLKKFLAKDEVHAIMRKMPSEGKYECVDYATELHNLAEKSGIA